MIEKTLEPLLRDISSLKHDPNNARKHNAANLRAITVSLERFGQQKPIVATTDGTVVAGNATLAAARQLGWSTIAVSVFNGTPSEARAYALADNRAAELAEWDNDILFEQLSSLPDDFNLDDFSWLDDDMDTVEDVYSGDPGAKSIRVTQDQREVIEYAIHHVRTMANDPDMPEGRAVELICGDFMAGK